MTRTVRIEASSDALADLTVKEVLRLQGAIVQELRDRHVIRTRNVVGELAETVVARAFGGVTAPPSQAGWDVLVGHRKLQVKCRMVEEGERRTQQFTPFGVDDAETAADAFVFVVLNAVTYEVVWALEIATGDVVTMSSPVPRSSKRRVNVRQVRACTTAVDVTSPVREAYAELDVPRGANLGACDSAVE